MARGQLLSSRWPLGYLKKMNSGSRTALVYQMTTRLSKESEQWLEDSSCPADGTALVQQLATRLSKESEKLVEDSSFPTDGHWVI